MTLAQTTEGMNKARDLKLAFVVFESLFRRDKHRRDSPCSFFKSLEIRQSGFREAGHSWVAISRQIIKTF